MFLENCTSAAAEQERKYNFGGANNQGTLGVIVYFTKQTDAKEDHVSALRHPACFEIINEREISRMKSTILQMTRIENIRVIRIRVEKIIRVIRVRYFVLSSTQSPIFVIFSHFIIL